MQYTIEKPTLNQTVIRFTGRLDAAVVQEMKTILKGTVADGSTLLVVDLDGVDFIDSSGLSALVSGFKAVQEQNGMLVLARVGDQIRVALELTRLNQIFPVFDELEAALDHLSQYVSDDLD